MAPVFSPDIIARVKDETDIVEVVRRTVALKTAGSVLKGLCPFHREKTPSFIVTPARMRYHCFGCGTGGDVFTFVMETEGVTFPEAVEILARPLDIDLSSWLREDEGEGERRAFHRANETATGLWSDALWDDSTGSTARDYLTRRGFTEKVLRDFDVGWAPRGSQWLGEQLQGNGVDLELAVASDLIRRGDHGTFAYFRGRIIFPIRSISRQVTGFGGRVIDQGEPKYLNSADSTYFSKGKLLYGFDMSRMAIAREKTAILVEGYLDLLALVQAGIPNVVATCGTAFTPDQARLIRRGAPGVLLVFDGDKAGLKAAVRSADVALRAGLEPRIVRLPTGEDPASLLVGRGVAAMTKALRAAEGYIPLLKALADERGGGREVAERAVRQALGTVAGVTDPLRREYLLQETGEVFGLGPEILQAALAGVRRDQPRPRPSGPVGGQGPALEMTAPGPSVQPSAPPRRLKYGVPLQRGRIEADLFRHVLGDDSGDAARAFLADCGDLVLSTPDARQLAREIAAWAAADAPGGPTPQAHVEQCWNQTGDASYRGYVSGILHKEDFPERTEFVTATTDILRRLRQAPRGPGEDRTEARWPGGQEA